MILLVGILAGFFAGFLRAKLNNQPYQPIQLKSWWLVLLAFIPQFLVFQFTPTSQRIPDEAAPFALVGSQIILILFFWLNRRQPGFYLLGTGLVLNFLVILLNGGLMPISPETIARLLPGSPAINFTLGERLGNQKDVILSIAQTRLWFLSDIFTLPGWLKVLVAFSPGDVLIALGAFWLFWSLGSLNTKNEMEGLTHEPAI
jgi:hypothetical protein